MAMDSKCCKLNLDKQESEKPLGALDLGSPLSHGTYPKAPPMAFMVKMRKLQCVYGRQERAIIVKYTEHSPEQRHAL